MPTLYLIRGVPGSGKTTLARAMADALHAFHVETDQFFETPEGYRFDPEKIKAAHEWCQSTVKDRLNAGDAVIVSNTFTRIWEMQFYLDLGFPVVVLECKGTWNSVHPVPVEAIQKMRGRWESYPEVA